MPLGGFAHVVGLAAIAFGLVPIDAAPTNNNDSATDAPFMVILFDGFRWDYLDRKELPLPGFRAMKDGGAWAKYMNPIFPSLSYPGYYSIVTGLYPESHGFVGNTMYDPVHRDYFEIASHPYANHSHWWEEAEPLWITTTKHELKTRLYLWPGCEVTIRGTRPDACEPYRKLSSTNTFLEHVDAALAGIGGDGVKVVLIYCELPDAVGHKYGPQSAEMNDAIVAVDEAVQKLLAKIEDNGLDDKLNVVIVSDHGMTATDGTAVQRRRLTPSIDMGDVEFILDRGVTVGVYPSEGKLDKVYKDLQQIDGVYVWKREDIPEELHIKRNNRTAPILVAAKKGYFIEGIRDDSKQHPYLDSAKEPNWLGFHGYNVKEVEDMRAIFLARGPAFKNSYEAPPIEMTDVYNVMMKVIGVTALPNNGSWDSIGSVLKSGSGVRVASPLVLGIVVVVVLRGAAHSIWL